MLGVWSLALVAVASAAAASAGVWYEDSTAESGVDVRTAGEIHDEENNFWPGFPEIMGAGACFADFDGDGLNDLFVVNQVYNPENPLVDPWRDSVDPTSRYYVNDGDGTFTDRSVEAGLDVRGFGYACSAADYDGDGDVDLLVTGFGVLSLFRNEGDGTFANATAEAGLVGLSCGTHACMSTSSAWGDYDLDGDLDAYVANYVDTNLTDVVRGPLNHVAQENWLFRNEGDGTFTEVARELGVQGLRADHNGGKSLGVVWFDAELDGDLDLYVANDETPNNYYQNDGDGTFTDRSAESNLANPFASMGVATGDYDNDGFLDLFFTHYSFEHNGFYRNLGTGHFEDRSGEDDLRNSWSNVGWGTAFVDFDRDGWLDLVVTNGHTEWAVPHYGQRTQLYRNAPNLDPAAEPGDRNWTDVSHFGGPGLDVRRVTRGAAFADYDYDGDTDMVLVNNNNETALFLTASEVEGRWLTVTLRQPGPNPHAIGARVVLEAAGLPPQTREVQAGSSYLSQNALDLEFGLGQAVRADRITVHWPGGGTTVVTDVPADRVVRIDRATGAAEDDTLSPLTTLTLSGSPGSSGWWHSPVSVTIAAEDRGVARVSGVASTEHAIDDGAWTAHDGGALTFGEGEHRVHARSADAAGNVEPRRSAVVRVDLTLPTTTVSLAGTAGENGWWVSDDVTVTLAAEDAFSGVAGIRYRLDGGAWMDYASPFVISEDGVHVVEYRATDVAGNVGVLTSAIIKLDHTPPTVALTSPDLGHVYVGSERVADLITGPAYVLSTPRTADAGGHEFPVAAAASDDASGVARVEFRLNDAPAAADAAGPYEWTWDTREHASGLYLHQAQAVDAAGNTAISTVRVVLASATPEGAVATVERGPSRHVGIGPVDGAEAGGAGDAEEAAPSAAAPSLAVPLVLGVAAVHRLLARAPPGGRRP